MKRSRQQVVQAKKLIKMLSAFTNSLKIPELRQKIFFTLALLFIARVGANIPLPGVDPSPIKEFFELREQTRSESEGNDILGFYNMFTGGALIEWCSFCSWDHALHQCIYYNAVNQSGFPTA